MIATLPARGSSELERGVEMEVPELPVIELVRPMPGFSDDLRFTLVRLDDDGTLCELRSLEHADLRFLVVSAGLFFADYAPEISDEDALALDLTRAEDALVLVLLNPGDSLESTTANLLAPVVVNTNSLKAAQVVLDDRRHSLATPLVR
ncbi:flagellar assembly protein FliW [Nocardioides sp. Bht2]|uniref:flagellar assembly protein FliW n=1 Tax=Nocardioides sp. Bht2 TaxID=3392297 RepID=UPI0039B5257B